KSKVSDKIVYVMICLNDMDTPPTYFIARGDEIRHMISEYDVKGGRRGILNYGKINSDQFKSRWDKIDNALQKTVLLMTLYFFGVEGSGASFTRLTSTSSPG